MKRILFRLRSGKKNNEEERRLVRMRVATTQLALLTSRDNDDRGRHRRLYARVVLQTNLGLRESRAKPLFLSGNLSRDTDEGVHDDNEGKKTRTWVNDGKSRVRGTECRWSGNRRRKRKRKTRRRRREE